MDLRKNDLLLVGGLALAFLLAAGTSWWYLGDGALPLVAGLGFFFLLTVQFELYRRFQRVLNQGFNQQRQRLERKLRYDYEQIEALFTLFSQFRPQALLPPTRRWAASPDFLRTLWSLIQETQPRQIVEAGCGVSTLVAAYCLRALGQGHIVTFEHQAEFAERCRQELARHGLEQYATIVHAPLRDIQVNGATWRWYDQCALEGLSPIDLLVIDGPSQAGHQARYPALPLLWNRLAPRAAILLDDGARPGEKAVVERWLEEHPMLAAKYLPLEKGAYVLRRSQSSGELRKAG